MRLTIVPSDNVVIVDGKVLIFDLSSFPVLAGIHAVQWDGTRGHLEYVQGDPHGYVHNTPLTSIDAYADIVTEWKNRAAAP